MRPPKQSQMEYERIHKYDEWIPGVIEEIRLEENRATGFKDDKTGAPKFADQVRFKFKLEGQEYAKYSRWMTYSLGEKANLFLKYIKFLVEGAQPDMAFDLDLLKGFKIKTMWTANGDFDNLEQIRPVGAKYSSSMKSEPVETDAPEEVTGSQASDEILF